jgi:formylglycine-generating enzyme
MSRRESRHTGSIIFSRAGKLHKMASKPSSAALVFEKVLREFEAGGFTYSDVLGQLKRLLAIGESPTELLDILQRRELVEPLPAYAHAEFLGLLNEAIGRSANEAAASAEGEFADPEAAPPPAAPSSPVAGLQSAPTPSVRLLEERIARQNADYETLTRLHERAQEAESSAAARATALMAELATARAALKVEQSKSQEAEKLLAANAGVSEAARSRNDEVAREIESRRAESTTLREQLAARDAAAAEAQRVLAARDVAIVEAKRGLAARDAAIVEGQRALAARDATIVEAQRALAARDAQLAALQQEHATLAPALEARGSALAADLAAARAAVLAEQSKGRETQQALDQSLAAIAAEAARTEAARAELKRVQGEAGDARQALAARGAELLGLRREHEQLVAQQSTLEKSSSTQRAELQSTRDRAEALAAELRAERDAAARVSARLERSESQLEATRTQLGAVEAQSNTYLETLRTREWRREFDQNMVRELNALPVGASEAIGEALELEEYSARVPVLPEAAAVPAMVAPADASSAAAAPPTIAPHEEPVLTARLAADFLAPLRRTNRWRPTPAHLFWVGAGVLVLAIGFWLFTRHSAVTPQVPVAAALTVAEAGTVLHDCPSCPDLTVVPAGRFKQGAARADSGPGFERPQHWVIIGRPFAMSTNAITVDQFDAFIAASGRDMEGCETYDGEWKARPKGSWKNPGFTQSGTHPVTCVSWNDAKAYAEWLSAKAGHEYRLPSASEWEFAARAGREESRPWSADGSSACANANLADKSALRAYPGWTAVNCDDGYVYTAPVGSFKANAFGLNDMLGNVFQWTEDCWHADYVGAPIDGSARTDGECSEHELRGGSWFSNPGYVRADYRNDFAADYRTSSVGIRLVRDLP